MNNRLNWRSLGWPVYLALAFLGAILLFFLYEMVTFDPRVVSEAEATAQADNYAARVAALLEGANPDNAPALIEQYACGSCHIEGAVRNIAPAFEGVADRAATRKPPLTAAEYLYESIMHPAAYTVEGYPNVMPQNYPDRLSDRELGDLLAYLLTLHTEATPEAE
jgi:cytochrome c551/c552